MPRRELLAQRRRDLDQRCDHIDRLWNDLQVDDPELHDIYTSCDSKTLAPAACPPVVAPRTRSELSEAASTPRDAAAVSPPDVAEPAAAATEPQAVTAVPWRPLVRQLQSLRQQVEQMAAQVDGGEAGPAAGTWPQLAPLWPAAAEAAAADSAPADPPAAVEGAMAELAARIASYELAGHMQMTVPDAANLKAEPPHIRKLYGADSSNKDKVAFAEKSISGAIISTRLYKGK